MAVCSSAMMLQPLLHSLLAIPLLEEEPRLWDLGVVSSVMAWEWWCLTGRVPST